MARYVWTAHMPDRSMMASFSHWQMPPMSSPRAPMLARKVIQKVRLRNWRCRKGKKPAWHKPEHFNRSLLHALGLDVLQETLGGSPCASPARSLPCLYRKFWKPFSTFQTDSQALCIDAPTLDLPTKHLQIYIVKYQ